MIIKHFHIVFLHRRIVLHSNTSCSTVNVFDSFQNINGLRRFLDDGCLFIYWSVFLHNLILLSSFAFCQCPLSIQTDSFLLFRRQNDHPISWLSLYTKWLNNV